MKRSRFHVGLGCLPLGIFAACAAAPPPRELIDARQAYDHAASSEANQLSPAAVHDARKAPPNNARAKTVTATRG